MENVIHQRLRAWGLNTIANWSDLGVALLRRTPYTDSASSRGVTNVSWRANLVFGGT